jgi:3-isopropylmalate/(R)-2-methylmalate dehydratase small subunit
MALAKIQQVTGRAVPIPGEDIDTDRIVPARYLKCVTFDGLGEHLFRDVRFQPDGSATDHPLNDPRYAGATILVAGRNFGCGSSREHAPQSIAKYGFKAMIAESFAEIFFGNSIALGLPCVSLPRGDIDTLVAHIKAHPETVLTVDLAEGAVRAQWPQGDVRFACSIKPGAREALQNGLWDPIGLLLEHKDDIRAVASSLPYLKFA